jgi:6-phosphogluconolactonase
MKRSIRSSFLSLSGAAALTAGVMMASPANATTFVYVGATNSNEIHVLTLDPKSGDLTPVEQVTVPGITKPDGSTPMAISADKRILFAGTRGDPKVAASFRIDPASGKLTHIANGPLADSMAYIFAEPTGKFLLSASYPGHKITVNPIAADGTVQPPAQVMATEPNAHAILADAANRYVLVPSLGGDIIHQLKFDAATGTLSPNTPPSVAVKAKAGPRHIRFHPNGKLVYLLTELDSSLYVFDYDADKGTLTQKQMVSTVPPGHAGKLWSADLHLTPDGKYLYASDRGPHTLAAFKVDPANGTVTLIEHYPTEQQPRGFKIDPSGNYLLAVGQMSDSMTSYRIDPATGKLAKLKQYSMGKNPNWVEIIDLP